MAINDSAADDDIDLHEANEHQGFLERMRQHPQYQVYIMTFQTAILVLLLALVIATYIRVQHTLEKVDKMTSVFPSFPPNKKTV